MLPVTATLITQRSVVHPQPTPSTGYEESAVTGKPPKTPNNGPSRCCSPFGTQCQSHDFAVSIAFAVVHRLSVRARLTSKQEITAFADFSNSSPQTVASHPVVTLRATSDQSRVARLRLEQLLDQASCLMVRLQLQALRAAPEDGLLFKPAPAFWIRHLCC
jgi:hypothetical protein